MADCVDEVVAAAMASLKERKLLVELLVLAPPNEWAVGHLNSSKGHSSSVLAPSPASMLAVRRLALCAVAELDSSP